MAETTQDKAETGRLAGFGAGAVAGAQLGTILIPIPFVGTFAGTLLGGAIGSRVGQRFGPTVLGTLDSIVEGKPAAAATAAPRASSIPITTPEQEAPASGDFLAQLERLGKLRSQGLLSEDEFAAAKAKLLK